MANSHTKKLCIIIPTHWEAVMGGSQYQGKILIEELLKRGGYEISYLASRIDPSFSPEGYEIIRIAERKGLGRHLKFVHGPKLLELLRDIEPDLIYQRVGCAYTGIAAYYAKRHGCKMVWHVAHDRTLMPFDRRISRDLLFRYAERKMLEYGISHADHIVAQTEGQKELLETRFGRAATVIPNFHPAPREEIHKPRPIKVVWVANLKQWKRPELFVRLASELQVLDDVEFLMVGEPAGFWGGQRNGDMEERMASLPNLRYLGARSQDEVNALLATAHIFVNTSRYEGFANTFIQAWMRKVPVVSLEVDPDQVVSREGVGLFADGDYEKMREQVRALVQDDRLRNEMGETAQRYALANHSVKNVERLLKVFEARGND